MDLVPTLTILDSWMNFTLLHDGLAPWLIGGDFNITRFLGERRGPELYLVSMADFNDFISELSLIEPPLYVQQFTWPNDHLSPLCGKLDGFLYSPN